MNKIIYKKYPHSWWFIIDPGLLDELLEDKIIRITTKRLFYKLTEMIDG